MMPTARNNCAMGGECFIMELIINNAMKWQ